MHKTDLRVFYLSIYLSGDPSRVGTRFRYSHCIFKCLLIFFSLHEPHHRVCIAVNRVWRIRNWRELLTSEPNRYASMHSSALITRFLCSSLKAAALAFVSSVCPIQSLVNSNVHRHWHCRFVFPLIAYPDTFRVISSASRSSYFLG